MIDSEIFESKPDVVSGAVVFKGTRIPASAFFENLAGGVSLADILDSYPAIGRERAEAAILLAGAKIERSAA